MSKGYFEVTSKVHLDDIELGHKFETSDYATQTPAGNFIQMKYIEVDDSKEKKPVHVSPGIFSMKKTMTGMYLDATSFTKDPVLEDFVETNHIEEQVDKFFEKISVYEELGIENVKRSLLLTGRPGCHARGTQILMFDGSIKAVESIRIGDLLMGPDSRPRKVLELASGREKMIKVSPTNGDDFVVNYNHIFHLAQSGQDRPFQFNLNIKGSDLIENTGSSYKERLKLVRTGVDFLSSKDLPIPAYILGSWLGDGHSSSPRITTMEPEIINEWTNYANSINLFLTEVAMSGKAVTIGLTSKRNSGPKNNRNPFITSLKDLEVWENKHIPQNYLTSNRNDRLELLAGLLDTDGSLSDGGFEIIQKSDPLAQGILYLARSLGFAAYSKKTVKSDQFGTEGIYNRIFISGDCSAIPVRLERKKAGERQQIKDVLRTGFSMEILPEGEYFGFALSGDHLYLTSDFTIHHNTGKTTAINKASNKYGSDGKTLVLVWHTDVFEADEVKGFIQNFEYEKHGVTRMLLNVEDLGGQTAEQSRVRSDSSLLSLLDNKEKTFKKPVFILATTNNPEMFQENITDRPERFDNVIEVKHPGAEARAALLKFFNKGKDVEEEAIALLKSPRCDQMSPAHIREVVIRSRLFDKTQVSVINELLSHSKKYQTAFSKASNPVGF